MIEQDFLSVGEIGKIVLRKLDDDWTLADIVAAAISNLETAMTNPVIRKAIIKRMPRAVTYEQLLASVDYHASQIPFESAEPVDEVGGSIVTLSDVLQVTPLALLWEALQ